jgi:hypothetical protein
MRTIDAARAQLGRLAVLVWAGAALLTACSGKGSDGADGADGADGTSCTAVDNGDGTKTVSCSDGSSFTIRDGADGRPALEPGRTPGLDVVLSVSAPANGTHFVPGESIVVTATLLDGFNSPLDLDALGIARLTMSGPRSGASARTAVSLLGASSDRSAAQHHLVDLKAAGNPRLTVLGNRLTYTLAPITAEESGTYTIGLRAVVAEYPLDQVFALADVQIGTATAEPIVVGNCDGCHRGAASGQMYLHHADPGASPAGSPALDSDPVRTCNQCHNQEGYAAVRKCDDGSIAVSDGAGAYRCADGSTSWSWMPDSTVHRVHGVHRGSGLANPTNIDPAWGLFRNYAELVFPADVRSCTTCHLDDAWKTRPSRSACGSCHDAVDWTTGANHDQNGAPGAQANDDVCAACHVSASPSPPPYTITGAHAIPPIVRPYEVAIALTPAPANGTFYVDENPDLELALTTLAGDPVDWTSVTTTTWSQFRLFVSGPRDATAPVLTDLVQSPSAGQDQYVELRMPAGGDIDARIDRTGGNVLTYDLVDDAVPGLRPGTYTVFLRFRKGTTEAYGIAQASFQVGTATEEPRPASGCTSCHGATGMHAAAYPYDTDICKSCHDYALGQSPEISSGWNDNAWGYGRTPLVRYVHQMHYGHYLTDTTVEHYDTFRPVVFPQDVRNCTSCHAESDAWKEKPSRLACTACHDSPTTWVHVTLATIDPTPAQPYSGDEAESCTVCHGPDDDFSPAVVHDVWDPYAPPYPREP